MMRLDLATDDYIGARAQQQDSAAARSFGSSGGAVLVLADGLGGHTGGAEASRIVIETFRDAADRGVFDEAGSRRTGLRATLETANERIANGVDPEHGQRGMASTAVAVVLADGMVHWISIGDSHLYVWRGGRIAKLNEDHSQAGLMVRSGQYKPTDPEVAAAKSVLVSALTGRKLEIVDHPAQAFPVQQGDIVLLASDGLNTLSEQEIQEVVGAVQEQGARQVGVALLDHVRGRRLERQDNTAVVVARVMTVPVRTEEATTEIAANTLRVTAPTAVAEPVLVEARTVASEIEASAHAMQPEHEPERVDSSKARSTVPPVEAPTASAGAPLHEAVSPRRKPPSVRPPVRKPGPPPGLVAKLLLGFAVLTAAAGTYLVLKLPKDTSPKPAASAPAGVAVPAAKETPAPPAEPPKQQFPIRPPPGTEPTRTPGALPNASPAPVPVPNGEQPPR